MSLIGNSAHHFNLKGSEINILLLTEELKYVGEKRSASVSVTKLLRFITEPGLINFIYCLGSLSSFSSAGG